MQIKPLNDFVFVKRAQAEKVTPSGLHIPESAKGEPTRGTVLAVGPGTLLKDGSRARIGVEPGETIVFAKFAGQEFEHEGEKILVVKGQDILCSLG